MQFQFFIPGKGAAKMISKTHPCFEIFNCIKRVFCINNFQVQLSFFSYLCKYTKAGIPVNKSIQVFVLIISFFPQLEYLTT